MEIIRGLSKLPEFLHCPDQGKEAGEGLRSKRAHLTKGAIPLGCRTRPILTDEEEPDAPEENELDTKQNVVWH